MGEDSIPRSVHRQFKGRAGIRASPEGDHALVSATARGGEPRTNRSIIQWPALGLLGVARALCRPRDRRPPIRRRRQKGSRLDRPLILSGPSLPEVFRRSPRGPSGFLIPGL